MIELDNYAKNKAVYILKCLREGTQPQPGPSAIGAADGAASAEPARIPSGPPASTDYGMPQVPSSRPSDSGYDYGMPQVPPSQPSGAFDFGLPEVPSSQPSQSFGGYGAPGGSASSPYGMPPTAPPAPAAVQPPTQPAPHFNPAPPQAFVPLSTPPPMMAVGTSFTPKASVTIAEENEVRPTLLKIRSRPPPIDSHHICSVVFAGCQSCEICDQCVTAFRREYSLCLHPNDSPTREHQLTCIALGVTPCPLQNATAVAQLLAALKILCK
jgi:hypothetical protein